MDVIKKIIAFIRKLLGMEKTIHTITKPITKIVDQLEQLAQDEHLAANQNSQTAAQLLDDAQTRRKNAAAARAFASGLTGGVPAIEEKDAA